MRHGFKAQAERLALQARAAIGQGVEERLELPALRAHLQVAPSPWVRSLTAAQRR
jgi:hypothetical protein